MFEMELTSVSDLNPEIPRCYDLTVDYSAAPAVKDLLEYILVPKREVRFGNRGFGKESRCVIRVWLTETEQDFVEDIFRVNDCVGDWNLKLTDFESGRI